MSLETVSSEDNIPESRKALPNEVCISSVLSQIYVPLTTHLRISPRAPSHGSHTRVRTLTHTHTRTCTHAHARTRQWARAGVQAAGACRLPVSLETTAADLTAPPWPWSGHVAISLPGADAQPQRAVGAAPSALCPAPGFRAGEVATAPAASSRRHRRPFPRPCSSGAITTHASKLCETLPSPHERRNFRCPTYQCIPKSWCSSPPCT